jgi:hypothetical protein
MSFLMPLVWIRFEKKSCTADAAWAQALLGLLVLLMLTQILEEYAIHCFFFFIFSSRIRDTPISARGAVGVSVQV